ncbi:hypothetical protein HOD88_03450 [archaeon]|jgi:hypothetical protein|nr:hypothetical protein [archaeon]
MKNVKLFSLCLVLFFIGIVSSEITGSIDSAETCNYRWFCTEWSPELCPDNGIQTRVCTNAGDCLDSYKPPIESRGCESEVSQLFDIKLELAEEIIYDSSDLTAWVRFENFGIEKSSVNMTYSIFNLDGELVFERQKLIEVETELFVIEKFEDLSLEKGRYKFVFKSIYGEDVTDLFVNEFEIKDEKSISRQILIILSSLIILYLILLIFRKFKERDVENPKNN